MYGLAAWLERFLAERGVERVRLVVHDWGSIGLLWAMPQPERVERLVVMNAVPFLPGYRWHRWARMWRTRGLGEIAVGSMVRPVMKLVTREATPRRGPMPGRFLDEVAAHLDQGTQRAIVQLYRGAPEAELARAGEGLGRIACPALVLWGRADPYIPERFAHGYAAALGDATLELVDGAGHWPWLDRPEVVDRVAGFLAGA
jgi:pimeloyl-ACP methyl ester carboxylesterase